MFQPLNSLPTNAPLNFAAALKVTIDPPSGDGVVLKLDGSPKAASRNAKPRGMRISKVVRALSACFGSAHFQFHTMSPACPAETAKLFFSIPCPDWHNV